MLLVLMSSDVSSSRLESSPSPPVTCVDILVHGLTDNALYGNKVSKLQVRVHTLDVDGIDINTSTVMIGMRWEGLNSTIPFQRQSLASNVFAAEIPQEVRSSAGAYQLDVVLFGGWDSSAGQAVKECTLLQQRLVVLETKEFNSLWVLLISACVFGFLIGLVIIVVKRKSKQIQHILRVAVCACSPMHA